MNFRRTLLRVMLVALALAALAGGIGILTAAGSGLWRFVGTNILTAVAIALMLPASKAMDAPKRRDGGLAALIWIVGAFLLMLALIWLADRALGHFEDRLGLLILYWCLCGLPAVVLCFAIHAERFRSAAFTGLAMLAVMFAALTIGTLIDPESRAFESVVVSSVALTGFGATILLNLANVGRGDRRFFRWIGIAAAALGFLASLAMIWGHDYSSPAPEAAARLLLALSSIAALSGMLNVFLLVPLAGAQVYVRWGTLAAAGLCALCLNFLAERLGYDADETLSRLAGAAGIAAACGTLAMAVLARLNRRAEYSPAEASTPMFAMWAICPRCKSKQHFQVNGTTCTACHLRVDIRIEEPRCVKCNYLLYMLKSPNCPECGTPVIEAPLVKA